MIMKLFPSVAHGSHASNIITIIIGNKNLFFVRYFSGFEYPKKKFDSCELLHYSRNYISNFISIYWSTNRNKIMVSLKIISKIFFLCLLSTQLLLMNTILIQHLRAYTLSHLNRIGSDYNAKK